ncbi:MAG TPA: glycosyltransferase [Stenotrophomonas sp.]|nr:glycosyltransferase [Stenotrophomonas sp.]
MSRAASIHGPLVSVVMPAFKPLFLKAALASVAAQRHRALELVVCDDHPGDAVREIMEAFAPTVPFPVRYYRNAERLRESRNGARCVSLARGEYIKFLYDDDVLHPDCIAAQVAVLVAHPDIALATSRRRRIDARGQVLPDTVHTAPLFPTDVRLEGRALVRFLGQHPHNFIGEPSAAMCRRADLATFGDRLMDLDGQPIHWFGDLAMYAKLLQRGDLAYLAAPLSDFRVSAAQFSQFGRERPGVGEGGLHNFQHALRALGWSDGEGKARVPVSPLDGSAAAVDFDLLQALALAEDRARVQGQLDQWQQQRQLLPVQHAQSRAYLDEHGRPALSILLDARHADDAAIAASLDSLAPHLDGYAPLQVWLWGVEVAPAGSAAWARPWPCGGTLADALNALMVRADAGDWLLQAVAGDVFCSGALQRLPLALAEAPPLRALFADEWHRGGGFNPPSPVLRPDFDLDLLIGHPAAMAPHWLFARAALLPLGGFDPTWASDATALALDMILRLAERGTDDLAHLPEPLLYTDPPVSEGCLQAAAITAHLHRCGHAQASVARVGPGLFRPSRGQVGKPKVSIVLVTDAQVPLALIQRCVISLLEKTAYADYEILLVDNDAGTAAAQWMQELEGIGDARLRLFALDVAVAHAAAANLAATQARGQQLLFLRADAAIVQPQWLDALLEHGLRDGVGVTGARTVSADGRTTQAGLLPGLADGAIGAFTGEAIDAPGYLGRLRVAHATAAVSDRCLLVARALFERLGGFDAETFPQAGADIDLCLRARGQGYRVLCVPDALVLHADVPALPADAREQLLDRWLPQIAGEPTYHPAQRLDVPGGFRLGESGFSWHPLPHRPQPRVLAHPADAQGSGQYRVLQPLAALRAAGHIEGVAHAGLLDIVEQSRIDPDVVILQRRVGEADLARIAAMPRHSRALKVYELDDYLLELPRRSAHRAQLPADIRRALPRALSLVDRLVVSTPALADALTGLHPDIRIARNRLPRGWWMRLPQLRRNVGPRPRVGWAGGISHGGDLEMIAEVVRTLADEVDWVFMGLCPPALQRHVREFHPGVEIAHYPRALARLHLDLAIAPLEDNRFNACKSNLRLLEYGACAVPVVASDIEPYRGDLPVVRVRNRPRDWVAAIREQLADAEARAAAGDALREAVWKDWMLAGDGLVEWRAAWLP